MIALQNESLTITIRDCSPDERRGHLIKSLARTMLWYAVNPDKRDDDTDHAATIILLLEELVDIDTKNEGKNGK